MSPVVGAANGSAGVAISPIVVTDVPGGTLTATVKFTANAGDSSPRLARLRRPSGVTITGPSETVSAATPSSTLTYTIAAGTVPAGGKFTLTGAVLNLANSASSHKVTVGTGAGSATAVGGATEYATTAAEARSLVSTVTARRVLCTTRSSRRRLGRYRERRELPGRVVVRDSRQAHATGILLTDPNTLSQDTQQELQADPIATVYIVGGTAAVSTTCRTRSRLCTCRTTRPTV